MTMRCPAIVVLLALMSLPVAAQMTKEGPAAQFYESSSNFSFDIPESVAEGPVKWTADSQEFVQDDYVILDGHVRIEQGDITIQADAVTYNFKTRDITAEGNVILDQGPRRLTATRIVFNLGTRTGTLFEATGAFEPSIYFSGDKIEKIDRDTFRLTNGVMTSCDIGDPSWSFHIRQGTITLEDYARMHQISFRAGRVPMLWLPYLVWPTKRERARGFLIPRPGYSDRYGGFLRNQYFIPFGDSADATLHLDLFSREYLGTGADVRYVPHEDVKGKLRTYVVRDPENRTWEWKYSYEHTQQDLPGGFRGVIDVRDFSDLQFFQVFERDFDLNTISNIYSSAYLTKNTPRYALNLRADRRELFLGDESEVFEQLPALQFSMYPTRLGPTPVYFALESSASNLRSTDAGDYLRSDIFPTLSLQMKTPAWLSIKPEVSLRQTSYTKSLDATTRQVVEDSLSRFYAQAQVEMVGPSLSRIYNRRIGNFSKFKHVVEPRVRYLYTTDVEDQERVIRFDTIDSPSIPLVNESVEYALVNRLIAKEDAENATAREIMSFEIRQSYSLSDPFSATSDTEGNVREHDFTPMRFNLRINPYRNIRIDAGAQISNVSESFERANVSANLSGEKRYLNLTWFARFKPPGQTAGDSSQIRVTTGTPVLGERLRFDLQVNYDIERSNLLEQRYLVGFYASCYNIAFEVRDFQDFRRIGTDGNSRTRDYLISLSLKNVGTFLDFRGSFDALLN